MEIVSLRVNWQLTQLVSSFKDRSGVQSYTAVFTRLKGITRTLLRGQHMLMMRTEMKLLFIWMFIARQWYSNPKSQE